MKELLFSLLDQDITVYCDNGDKYRGVLRQFDGSLLKFEVGIDIFYIKAHVVLAVTVHGMSQAV